MSDTRNRNKELKNDMKKRVEELEKEVVNDVMSLQKVLQDINILQGESRRLDALITSKKGGLAELKKLDMR